MSTINTNGINVNYPVPGENNSSQGFRDNFSNIKSALNSAASEISDLQNKVVLKQALANSSLNNDMSGALISNATTRFFRASTYNLGNALSGTVLVDVSLGDVQYGNVAGNITFQFGGWAPTNTESAVTLKLGISNANAVITFPSEVTSIFDGFGVTLLENFSNTTGVPTVTVPNGIVELDYQLTTLDCGNTIYITPLNRPFQSTQLQQGIPISTGLRGDGPGAISFGPTANQVSITSTLSSNVVINASVVSMPNSSINGTILSVGDTDNAVMDLSYISGTTLSVVTLSSGNIQIGMQLTGTGIAPGTTIVENITGTGSGSTWRVSVVHSPATSPTTITGSTPIQPGMLLSGTGVLANTFIVSNNNGAGAGSTWVINQTQVLTGPVTITGTTGIVGNLLYVGQIVSGSIAQGTILSGFGITTDTTVVDNISGSTSGSIWTVNHIQYAAPTTMTGTRNAIIANTTSNFYIDMPIVFTGNVFGNLVPGSTYYVKDIMTNTDFSVTLTPGGVGETYPISTGVGQMYGDPVSYLYVSSQNYSGTVIGPKSVTNTYATSNFVKLDNIVSLEVNSPIIFTGSMFGGLSANVPFYIKSIDSGNANITISRTIFNGIAGATYELATANSASENACQAFSTIGPDIWRQIPLLPSTSQGSNITAANITAAENLTVLGDATVVGNLNVSGTTVYGNTAYLNISTSGNALLENIFANNITTNTLTTNGLATFSDVSNVKIEGGLNGYYLQTDGLGNLAWVAGTTSPAPSTAAGSDTQVQYNDSGSFAGSAGFTFNDGSNTLSVTGNVNTGNVTATGNITTNNITVNELIYLTQVANVRLADSNSGNNGYYLQSDGLGGLVWSAGTLSPTGNGTSAGANNQVQIADGSGDFKAKAGFTFDTATDEFSTPGNFNVTGNVVSSNSIFANSGTVKGSLLTGTLTTAAQPNITSLGNLSSLTVNGTASANLLLANALTSTTIDPDTVKGFAAGNVIESGFTSTANAGIIIGKTTGQHGALVYTNNTLIFATEDGNTNSLTRKANLYSNGTFEANYFIGTIISPIQTSITRIGTLASLNVSGNTNSSNFIGNLANGTTNIRIPAAGGNINFSASANANVFVVSGLGANVNGILDVTGNIIADNANRGVFAGFVTANGNSTGNLDITSNVNGNLGLRAFVSTFTDNVAGTGNTIDFAAAHAIAAPTMAAANNNVTLDKAFTFAIKGEPVEGTNVNLDANNAYSLLVDGKSLFTGNIEHDGILFETSNINVAANTTTSNLLVTGTANLGSNSSIIISGGSIGQYLQTDGAGGLSWAAGTANVTGVGAANGSTGLVQFAADGTGNFGAFAGFTFTTATSTLNLPGNLNAITGRVTAANFVGQISNASPAQPNITSVGSLVSLTVSGNISQIGVNAGLKTTFVGLTEDGSGNTSIANLDAVTNYIGLRTERNRYIDTDASGTLANSAIHVIGQPKLGASNTGVTATNATTFYIEGAPVANTNMTITNGYALWSNGRTKIAGNLELDGSLTACSNVSFANIEVLTIGNTSAYAGYYLKATGNGSLEWSSGTVNASSVTAAGSSTQIQFNDSGTLVGNANLTFTKASANLFVGGNANIVGNLIVGNVIYNNAHSATAGQVLTVYANGLTYWATPSTSSTLLSNGTSNVSIPVSSGNIELNGTSTKYILLKGDTLATSTFSIGATPASAVTYQNTRPGTNLSFLKGNTDGTTLWSTDAGSIIANGTSNVSVVSSGNIALAVGGTVRGNVTTSGLVMTGTVKSGGVTYTNVAGTVGQVLAIYANGETYWSTVSGGGGGGTAITNGNTNVTIASAGSNVTIQVNNTPNIINIGPATTAVTGNITATANITATNQLNGANGVIGNLTANAYIIGSGGIITDSSTARTLSATDNGKIIYFTNAGAVTLNLATGLGAGFSCVIVQGGAGQVTAIAPTGTQRRSYGGAYRTAGQYATVSIICPIANEFFISGQTAV